MSFFDLTSVHQNAATFKIGEHRYIDLGRLCNSGIVHGSNSIQESDYSDSGHNRCNSVYMGNSHCLLQWQPVPLKKYCLNIFLVSFHALHRN